MPLRSLNTLPIGLEQYSDCDDFSYVQSKKRVDWHCYKDSKKKQNEAISRLHGLHQKMRLKFCYISAPLDLWYVKRSISSGAKAIDRYSMTIIMAAMHRLSELSRYDPKGLTRYFQGKENWLLSEFIETSPAQFIDEIACEITSLEFRIPAIRP